VRRELLEIYGEDKLEKGGLSVRTTLDPKLQLYARQALASGLIGFDRKRGWRGARGARRLAGDWGGLLKDRKVPPTSAPWRLAVVTRTVRRRGADRLQPQARPDGKLSPERETGTSRSSSCKWARAYVDGGEARPRSQGAADVVKPGDVVYVAPAPDQGSGTWCRCRTSTARWSPWTRTPAACSPWSAASPMAGASSTARSRRCASRARPSSPSSMRRPSTTAIRRPRWCSTRRSSSRCRRLDVEARRTTRQFYGPSTLRRGIEQSRNVMTVRLADDMGMAKIAEFTQRLGIYDKLPRQLAMALGAGETTLLKMTTAYAMIDNGGKRIEPTLIDRIQDRYGRTIFRHDQRDCAGCRPKPGTGQPEPEILDVREQVISPYTAYQITSMLEGVVERGTGKVMKIVGKPVAGKTGTTNDERDSWFIGFTPDLVVGVYVGYDNPKPMGRGRTGGELAAPIVADFMRKGAARQAGHAVPRAPRHRADADRRRSPASAPPMATPDVILEAFKPGDEPPDATKVIGE
jgi:penicillin-binding protein 1A